MYIAHSRRQINYLSQFPGSNPSKHGISENKCHIISVYVKSISPSLSLCRLLHVEMPSVRSPENFDVTRFATELVEMIIFFCKCEFRILEYKICDIVN
jgi:hypothetical protein